MMPNLCNPRKARGFLDSSSSIPSMESSSSIFLKTKFLNWVFYPRSDTYPSSHLRQNRICSLLTQHSNPQFSALLFSDFVLETLFIARNRPRTKNNKSCIEIMNHFNSSTKHKGLWMVIFFKNSNVTADSLDIWKCAFYSRNVINLSKNPISVPAVSHVDARLCWIVAQAQTTPPTFPPLWRGTCNTHINTQLRKNT